MNRTGYVSKMLTGHTHYRSPYESSDSCGTCDGAKCGICREVYEVEAWDRDDMNANLYKIVSTENEAKDILSKFVKGGSDGQ